MIGGFGVVGQSSTLSGTPSPSASSCTVPQEPSFARPSLWQVCGTRATHVCCPGQSPLTEHALAVLTLQCPTDGQLPGPVSAVQKVSLMTLHVPTARVTGCGLRQSPSQA